MSQKSNNSALSRVRRSYAVSTVSIALVLFLLGIVGYILTSVLKAGNELRESVAMIVEIKDNMPQQDRDSLAARLLEQPLITDVKFVSKEEKLSDPEFRNTFNVDIDKVLSHNPLPDSFDITLAPQAEDKELRQALVDSCRLFKGVETVSYPEDLLVKVHSTLNILQLVILLFAAALTIISLILLNNTIKLTIFSRRDVIKTLKLVGATRWYILKPFIGKAALQGLIAGIIATILYALSIYGLSAEMPEMSFASQMELIIIIAAAMVIVGTVIAAIFTSLVVNKFVNMPSNKIHIF